MVDQRSSVRVELEITVLIPTYHRPAYLARCLEVLKKQTRLPDEVLVVVRESDVETWRSLEGFDDGPLALRMVPVDTLGLVAARNAGLDAARGDIVAITDDDTAPFPGWLARIEAHFRAGPKVGAVGGLDREHHDGWVKSGAAQNVVGKVQWFGRLVSNHHLGAGDPREVDFLKGANMSYRLAAIQRLRFDKRLRGSGTQVADDVSFLPSSARAGRSSTIRRWW